MDDASTLPVGIPTSPTSERGPHRPPSAERRQSDEVIEAILRGTAGLAGDAFFESLVRELAQVLGARHAFVGELIDEDRRVRSLASTTDGRPVAVPDYDLAGTPCHQAVQRGHCYYPERAQEQFPDDPMLAALGVSCYLGATLQASDGRIIGLLCVMHDRPLPQPRLAASLLAVFAARAGGEIERLRAEAAHRQSVLLYDAVVAALTEGVLILDEDFNVIAGNESAWRLARANLVGRGALPPGSRALRSDGSPMPFEEIPAVVTLRTGEPVADQVVGFEFQDGEVRWLQMSAQPLRPDRSGTRGAVVVSCIDISARRAAEAEHRRLTEQLFQSQKTEALATLAGGIAHDFNNLLAIMLGEVTLLEEDMAPVAHLLDRSRLDRLRKAAERGGSLVRQLLAYARKANIHFETIDLNGIVGEVTQLVRETFPRSIEIEPLAAADPIWVRADEVQIQQVLLNLCVNARDAMPDGGRLAIETRLLPATGTAGARARLRVRDNGMGMDPTVRQRMFDPFFTTKDVGRGTGLGLAVVQGIVERHDGTIAVDSVPGRGTTFTIELPCAARPVRVEPAATAFAAVTGGTETVLVVEDEQMVRDVVRGVLSRKGYQCLFAEDGLMAVEMLALHRERIAVVLTDLGLPKLEGASLVWRLRQTHATVPILVTSGLVEPEVELELRAAGVREILWKPYDLASLASAVRRAIDGQAA
jgi:signal transduction histidine kinase/ActR/RegA family two-component response regulator